MPSLTDVAKAAGVSVTTASFVINGHAVDKRIAPQTAERVLNAVRELGYVPNVAARKLTSHSNRKNVVPEIAIMWSPDLHASFLGSFITNAQLFFDQNLIQKMHITIAPFAKGPMQTSSQDFLGRNYNGLVFSPTYDSGLLAFTDLNLHIPLIVLHVSTDLYPNVIVDNYGAGRSAAEVFAKKKHSSAAMLYRSQVGATSLTDLRFIGFRETCLAFNMDFSGTEIPKGVFGSNALRADFGRYQARHYLESKNLPEAIFIQDDAIATGFALELVSSGVSIPNDIEIITYGNDDLTCAIYPAITTVDYPAAKITLETLNLLSEQISDPYAAPKRIAIVPEITFRGSCPKPDDWI